MKKYLLLSLVSMLASCSFLQKWQTQSPDNFIEEAFEDFIEDQTGYDIDLSPFTGEETKLVEKSKK